MGMVVSGVRCQVSGEIVWIGRKKAQKTQKGDGGCKMRDAGCGMVDGEGGFRFQDGRSWMGRKMQDAGWLMLGAGWGGRGFFCGFCGKINIAQ